MRAGTLTHGNPLCTDGEYSGFVGAPRRVIIYDWTIHRYRYAVMQPLRTAAHTVTVADPEKQMRPEVELEGSLSFQDRIAANRESRYERWRQCLQSYLEEHGPQTVRKLTELCQSKDPMSVVKYLEDSPALYLRYWDSPAVYGLHGQSYKKPIASKVYEARTDLLRALLIRFGPMLIGELWKMASDIPSRRYLSNLVSDRDDVFHKIGTRRSAHGNMGVLWGVVGIHDKVAA